MTRKLFAYYVDSDFFFQFIALVPFHPNNVMLQKQNCQDLVNFREFISGNSTNIG